MRPAPPRAAAKPPFRDCVARGATPRPSKRLAAPSPLQHLAEGGFDGAYTYFASRAASAMAQPERWVRPSHPATSSPQRPLSRSSDDWNPWPRQVGAAKMLAKHKVAFIPSVGPGCAHPVHSRPRMRVTRVNTLAGSRPRDERRGRRTPPAAGTRTCPFVRGTRRRRRTGPTGGTMTTGGGRRSRRSRRW